MSDITDKQKELLKKFNSKQGMIETRLNKIKKTAQETIKLAIENGGILIELKGTVEHGEWHKFISDEISIGRKQCDRYVLLNKNQALLEKDSGDLFTGIKSACEYISEQKHIESDEKVKEQDVPDMPDITDEAVEHEGTETNLDLTDEEKCIIQYQKQRVNIKELKPIIKKIIKDADEIRKIVKRDYGSSYLLDWVEEGQVRLNCLLNDLKNGRLISRDKDEANKYSIENDKYYKQLCDKSGLEAPCFN